MGLFLMSIFSLNFGMPSNIFTECQTLYFKLFTIHHKEISIDILKYILIYGKIHFFSLIAILSTVSLKHTAMLQAAYLSQREMHN